MEFNFLEIVLKIVLTIFGGVLYSLFKAAPYLLVRSWEKWKKENAKLVLFSLGLTALLAVAYIIEPTFLSAIIYTGVDLKPYQSVINFLTGPIAAGLAVTAAVRNFLKIQASKLRGQHKRTVEVTVE